MSKPSVESVRRVFVADDGSLFCSELRAALSRSGLIEIVGSEHGKCRLPDSIRQIAPDLAIVPLRETDGVDFLRRLRDLTGESVAVLVVGESGPLPADSIAALGASVPRPRPEATVQLSNRELEVMRLASKGLTDVSIARTLTLSEATVKTYWRRIFKKLGVHDRTTAVIKTLSMGILPV